MQRMQGASCSLRTSPALRSLLLLPLLQLLVPEPARGVQVRSGSERGGRAPEEAEVAPTSDKLSLLNAHASIVNSDLTSGTDEGAKLDGQQQQLWASLAPPGWLESDGSAEAGKGTNAAVTLVALAPGHEVGPARGEGAANGEASGTSAALSQESWRTLAPPGWLSDEKEAVDLVAPHLALVAPASPAAMSSEQVADGSAFLRSEQWAPLAPPGWLGRSAEAVGDETDRGGRRLAALEGAFRLDEGRSASGPAHTLLARVVRPQAAAAKIVLIGTALALAALALGSWLLRSGGESADAADAGAKVDEAAAAAASSPAASASAAAAAGSAAEAAEDDDSFAASASKAIVDQPKRVLMIFSLSFVVLAAYGLRLDAMRATTRPLTTADPRILQEFPAMNDRMDDAVVAWCEPAPGNATCQLDDNVALVSKMQGQIKNALIDLQAKTPRCKDLSWTQAPSGALGWQLSAAKDTVSLHVRMTEPDCLHKLRNVMVELAASVPAEERYHLSMGGPMSLLNASMDASDTELIKHVMISIPLVSIFLWYVLGAFSRALTPILCVACALAASKACVVVSKDVFKANLNVDYQAVPIVFVAFAFSMDYALFFWARFRRHRAAGASYEEAIQIALRRAGPVIFISTGIICLAYFGTLWFPNLNEGGWFGMYLHQIFAVALVGVYSCTLTPALALLLPNYFDSVDGKCDGSATAAEGKTAEPPQWSPSWKLWADIVTSRPLNVVMPIVAFGCMLLFTTALPSYAPNFDLVDLGAVPGTPEFDAYNLLVNRFDVGTWMPTTVVLQALPASGTITALSNTHSNDSQVLQRVVLSPEFGRAVCDFSSKLLKEKGADFDIVGITSLWSNTTVQLGGKANSTCLADLQSAANKLDEDAVRDFSSADGTKQLLLIASRASPTGDVAVSMSRFLKEQLEPTAGTEFSVDGQKYLFSAMHTSVVSVQLEAAEEMGASAPLVWGLTCLVVFATVGAVYRAAFVPLKLMLTILLPIVSIFGLVIGVFQLNWLGWTGLELLQPTGGVPYNTVYLSAAILFGLAMDYDLFLFARVYEFRMEGYDNASAVRLGLLETGPVITVAGCLMAYSFFFIMLSKMACVRILGFVLFAGVVTDTFVIRMCIVPGILTQAAALNYWPTKLPPETKHFS